MHPRAHLSRAEEGGCFSATHCLVLGEGSFRGTALEAVLAFLAGEGISFGQKPRTGRLWRVDRVFAGSVQVFAVFAGRGEVAKEQGIDSVYRTFDLPLNCCLSMDLWF